MFCSRIIAGLWLLTHHGSCGCGAALHSVESETCNPFISILREVTRTDQRAKAVKLEGHSAVLSGGLQPTDVFINNCFNRKYIRTFINFLFVYIAHF